jgi:uncharacterized protein (DUF952 family)
MIYHILKKDKWKSFKGKRHYFSNSLEREGFIHCSFDDQLLKVANTLFRGNDDLLVLCIEETNITSIIKFEDLYNLREDYPHVYGEIPISSIVKVVELKWDKFDGFILPDLSNPLDLNVQAGEWT